MIKEWRLGSILGITGQHYWEAVQHVFKCVHVYLWIALYFAVATKAYLGLIQQVQR